MPASVELYGCDISSNNFPKDYPDNVRFQVAPATSLPEDWTNKFDFAHQRLLTAGLPGPDWPTAVSELFRVVKPGGHIQLLEVDFTNIVNAGPSTVRAYSLLSDLFDKRRLLFDCSKHLQRFAEAAGFIDVRSDKGYWAMGKKAWGGVGELGTKDMRLILRGMAPALRIEGIIPSEQDMYDLVDECAKEWDESEYGFRLASHILCARKPE